MWRSEQSEGAFVNFVTGLREHEKDAYRNFICMPPYIFDWLLALVTPIFIKENTNNKTLLVFLLLVSLALVLSNRILLSGFHNIGLLVALRCILSCLSMFFLRYGLHACIQYSKCRLIISLYRGTIYCFF